MHFRLYLSSAPLFFCWGCCQQGASPHCGNFCDINHGQLWQSWLFPWETGKQHLTDTNEFQPWWHKRNVHSKGWRCVPRKQAEYKFVVQIYPCISAACLDGKYVITSTNNLWIIRDFLSDWNTKKFWTNSSKSEVNSTPNAEWSVGKENEVWLQAGPAAGWMQVQEALTEICYLAPCSQTF